MKKFLLVDDHPSIRTALKLIIETFIDNSHIDEAFNGETAIEKALGNTYDIIILDINMPGTGIDNLIKKILSDRPSARILIFSMNDEAAYALKYFKLGVMGYLPKNKPTDIILKAINMVLANKKYFSEELFAVVGSHPSHDSRGWSPTSRPNLYISPFAISPDPQAIRRISETLPGFIIKS